jgi:E3 ubiquitin-protein ligase SHPRH
VFEEVQAKNAALQSIIKVDRRTFRLMILLPTSKHALAIDVEAPTLTHNVEHFRRVAQLSEAPISKRSKYETNVAWSQTTITPSQKNNRTFELQSRILWRDSGEAMENISPDLQQLLVTMFPQGSSDGVDQWSPRDFYDNVHVPPKTPELSADIKNDLLQCTLYPFQRRAVRWLLEREGVRINSKGQIRPLRLQEEKMPESFHEELDDHGKPCYVSHLLGTVVSDLKSVHNPLVEIHGGILAEEMGLGKTVEMISLITMNRRQTIQEDDEVRRHGSLKRSDSTLIITPPSILKQWQEEIQEHAPSLKVYHYQGLRAERKISDRDLIRKLRDYDVVVTTYNVIAGEIYYAQEAPDRNLRHAKQYESRKSPLVRIDWWRVVLDEAQMVESGVSNSAKVARLIPRRNAWAVSGTPLRRDVKDLYGLLHFLHYEPYSQSLKVFDRLVSEYRPVFKRILGQIALRHTKVQICDELRLPPQKRVIITVPFSAIEEQHYGQLFQQMCDECFVDRNGAPVTHDFDPESPFIVDRMRTWLMRLRQTCLHPEVGGRNRRALGAGEGPLRTVAQVLETMIEHNEITMRDEERQLILSQCKRGQMLENAKRSQDALDLWKLARDQAKTIVGECRALLEAELEKADQNAQDEEGSSKGKEVAVTKDDEEQAEKNSRIGTCRNRLKSALQVEHICVFFIGNAYFQIKSNKEVTTPDSVEFHALEKVEMETYDAAKAIRKEILHEIQSKVDRHMKKITEKAEDKTFVKIPVMKPPSFQGGIENRKIVEKLKLYCTTLNTHAMKLEEWRSTMVQKLLESLLDEDEGVELEGDEYEKSTKLQDEIYAYMEGLRAMFADRYDALNGSVNTLIDHEMKVALKSAKARVAPELLLRTRAKTEIIKRATSGKDAVAPELFIDLMDTRTELKPDPKNGSLRGIITEIRALITSLQWAGGGTNRAAGELAICNDILKQAQKMSSEHLKIMNTLEKEVELFRETMNTRLEYYRQFQQISDTVRPFQEERVGEALNQADWADMLTQEEKVKNKLSTLKAKARYLLHLRTESTRGADVEENNCVICQSSFEIGVLTVCGHQYCKDCLRQWWNDHRTCPVCKRHLHRNDFHEVTYKPQELIAREEEVPQQDDSEEQSPLFTGKSSKSSNKGIYSDVSTSVLNQIKNIDLEGSFGTKIDTIARHLLWLREHDPGSKTIVFSQFREFLEVLGRAFRQFKIGFSSIDKPNGTERFKGDPSVCLYFISSILSPLTTSR